ncbi:hypothetical protein BQ8482_530031 [Mesorhizobium delmotii]|uniref:Uncharacterized protein n=1 Tax=Mesorhizobium delmotii TaxID=1631247 RepID=A0A2P9AUR8_9HYPH|nr:hypothetical protein BQ8482_530031 [Mesorhizobium delmotii]
MGPYARIYDVRRKWLRSRDYGTRADDCGLSTARADNQSARPVFFGPVDAFSECSEESARDRVRPIS